MFVPLSDSMPCNRFVGTALYERLDAYIESMLNKLCDDSRVSDADLAELDMVCHW